MKQSIFYRHRTGSFVKKLWLFTLFFLFSLGMNAQCPTESVILTSQAEVNAFLTSYPNCTMITGSLNINGADIIDLTPLSNITKVGGFFYISSNDSLTNLNGLSSLTTVGGHDGVLGIEGGIRIAYNPVLTDISALSNLQSLTSAFTYGGIQINYNPLLAVCDLPFFCNYLANGNYLNNPISIIGNAPGCQNEFAVELSCGPPCPTVNILLQTQTEVDNFSANYPNCTELAGNLQILPIGSSLDLSSLNNLTKIGGNLILEGLDLTNLNGLNNLTEVGGYLRIDGTLTNIQALSNLTQVGGALVISGTKLQNLTGLDNLSYVGGRLDIADNTHLTSLTGLNGLTQIDGYLHIRNNPLLTTLSGLDNLTQIDGFIRILYNNTLSDISALSNIDITTILADSGNYVDPSGIIITNNPQLSNCSLSTFCTYLAGTGKRTILSNGASCNDVNAVVSICNIPSGSVYLYTQQEVDTYGAGNPTIVQGNLTIKGASITDLSPLSSLIKIQGKLSVNNNSLLENLDGLNNVTEIEGHIEIISNATIKSLYGLNGVTQMDGNIVLQNNALLSNIYGLENINSAGISQFKILSNSSLNSCDIESLCQYMSLGKAVEISGNSTVIGSTCTLNALSQRCQMTCPYGNVTFITQADINHFAERFATCQNASIQNLSILSIKNIFSDIVDLSPLEGIIGAVTGEFRLGKLNSFATQIPPLTTLVGLESLTTVGGNVYMDITNLENTNGLNNLSTIGGILRIKDNPYLQNLNGFSSLVSLSKNLEITNNAVLSDISGLSNITQINQTAYSYGAGTPTEYRGITITNNPNLAMCNLDVFCTYLNTTGAKQISGNAVGCQNANTIKSNCYYPVVVSYCPISVTVNSNDFIIKNVTFSGINNTTTSNSGYYDYTSQVAEVARGGSEDLQVTISPFNGNYINAFIDWNQDGVFQSSEKYIVTNYTTQAGPFITSINIPADAVLGQTRMRVILKYHSAPEACQNIQAGDIEDYTINVLEEVIETGYCFVEASNSSYEYITNVTFSDINYTTEGTIGYNNYTSQIAEVVKGGVVPIEVTINADSNDYLSVFIDWNQDEVFDAVSETYILAEDTDLPGPFTMNIAVPSDAVLGQTRMRVMLNWGGTPDSCQNITYGEIEDYTINVTDYCFVEASDSAYEYITNVTLSGINNTTSGTNGYNNYTSQIAEVSKGSTIPIEVTVSPDSNDYLSVFIDWNQDQVFDPVSETYILAEDTNLPGPFLMNIAIPSDAVLGQTRMRVMLNWGETPASCQSIVYGEIEDYTINVSETTSCETTIYTNSGWLNGLPNANKKAIVEGNLIIDNDLTACELEVAASGTVVVQSGVSLTVIGSIVNDNNATNSFVVQNDANLFQVGDVENIGIIKVERNSSALYRQDYTLWSSPVTGQNLRAFSTQTLFNRFSSYDTAIGTNGAYFQEIVTTADMNTKTFVEAKGYLIRMPNNWVEWNSGIPASPYLGSFTGNLKNGNIAIPLSGANTKFNLVGNPYPSPISIADFFAANGNVDETLYFWRKQGSGNANNDTSGYSTYTSLGIVSADASLDGTEPTHIEVGQGFFVVANSATPGNLVFNNTMRSNGNATFYKGANDATSELHRFWLNLSNETNTVGQTLMGYKIGATQGVDGGIDALYFNDSPVALTSIINDAEYIIQGRGLPFEDVDRVSLGFKTNVSGNYTISLSNFDGLFAGNQDIFLKDNATATLTNLKTSDYTFTTEIGVFNSRFEVQYNNATLDVVHPNLAGNTVLISTNNQKIQINLGSVIIDKIELIDVIGRIIYTQEGVNASTATLENMAVSDQILIVRICTKDNVVITQKILF